MNKFIPYGRHNLDQDDIKAVESVLKSDWLTCGSNVDAFEEKLCQITLSHYAAACSNGTTALHLAVSTLGIGPGDIVIVPAITFLATANAVRYVGADVVFADVDPNTGLMTANTLEEAIQKVSDAKKIKAVINVHFAGQCEQLEAIQNIAKKYSLYVIEDAAHAIGTTYTDSNNQNHFIGANAYSDLTTFSFHPVKTIATGEGGAVTTNNPEFAQRLKILRSHGMIRNTDHWHFKNQGQNETGDINPWYYEMHEIGFNYRISDINCALGISQLNKLEKFKTERNKLVKYYDTLFSNDEHIKPLSKLSTSNPAWHLYVLKIDFTKMGKSRAQLMKHLTNTGIGTQVHYIPLYKQPYYQNLYGTLKLEGAERYYASCLSIPLYIGLTNDQQEYIAQQIKTP